MKSSKLALSYHATDENRYDSGRSLLLELSVLVNRSENNRDKWRNPSDTDDDVAGFADLFCTGYAASKDGQGSFGWDVEYRHVYSIKARQAERMAKTLKAIDKKLTAMYQQEGSCATFGEYANRFARAIGADVLVLWKGDSSNYDDDGCVTFRNGEMRGMIDYKIAEFHRKHNPKQDEEAA